MIAKTEVEGDPTRFWLSRSALIKKQDSRSSNDIDENWSLTKNALHSADLLNCDLIRGIVTPWISA